MDKITTEDVKNYEKAGLSDLYYGLISFIGQYATQNFNPLAGFNFDNNSQTVYAIAINTMKQSLKELLDFFMQNKVLYIRSLGRNIDINLLNVEEMLALEEQCQEYIVIKLKEKLPDVDTKKCRGV